MAFVTFLQGSPAQSPEDNARARARVVLAAITAKDFSRVEAQFDDLVLQGERDYQVTMDEFARWKATPGSRRDVTFHSYPALNHLFIAGAGPGRLAEYPVAGHVDESVIRDIAAWVSASRR